jgi:hydrogenase expression/formation protein HypE
MKTADKERILLGHGSGGKLTHQLINGLFMKYFSNPHLDLQTDSAVIAVKGGHIAFTTDSFVVDPIFFPGGDIGKLAVCGTVNDIAVSGAQPLWLSAAFIIEEGFPMADLERVVSGMAQEAGRAGVKIVTGDTKVVGRNQCDKLFITTTGLGIIQAKDLGIGTGEKMMPGDKIIINGSIGDHGMAIMSARNDLQLSSPLLSDCASLNGLIKSVMKASNNIRFMRDATRGGLSAVIGELVREKPHGLVIHEEDIPLKENVRGMCELLGFDPMYVANEGKVLIVAAADDAQNILKTMQKHEYGREARIIGEIVSDHPGKAWLKTCVGGNRIIDLPAGEQLPRIC